MGFLPHILILFSLSLSLYLSLSISTSLSLTLSLSLFFSLISLLLSLSYCFKKIKGPQSLLQIGGDWGPIETVDLAVGEDVT